MLLQCVWHYPSPPALKLWNLTPPPLIRPNFVRPLLTVLTGFQCNLSFSLLVDHFHREPIARENGRTVPVQRTLNKGLVSLTCPRVKWNYVLVVSEWQELESKSSTLADVGSKLDPSIEISDCFSSDTVPTPVVRTCKWHVRRILSWQNYDSTRILLQTRHWRKVVFRRQNSAFFRRLPTISEDFKKIQKCWKVDFLKALCDKFPKFSEDFRSLPMISGRFHKNF